MLQGTFVFSLLAKGNFFIDIVRVSSSPTFMKWPRLGMPAVVGKWLVDKGSRAGTVEI